MLVLVLVSGLVTYAQYFPGGVKPFDPKYIVEQKLPFSGDLKARMQDIVSVSIDIRIEGILLTNVKCGFSGDQLTSMYLEYSAGDRSKILELLKKKYSTIKCVDEKDIQCFKKGVIKVELGDKYLVYRAEVESEGF